jgi:hypothetical protein
MKRLVDDTIQLLNNIINFKHLLYTYANVMQWLDNLSYEVFIIAYVIEIAFGFNLEQSIYNVPQMPLHLHNNLDNKNISPFLKHSHPNTMFHGHIVIHH